MLTKINHASDACVLLNDLLSISGTPGIEGEKCDASTEVWRVYEGVARLRESGWGRVSSTCLEAAPSQS